MNALKDKVTQKLSHILADSPSSSPKSAATDAPVLRSRSESEDAVRPFSKEEPHGSDKSVSSYLYSFLPTVNLGVYKSTKRRHDLKPFRSLSNKWRSKSFTSREKPQDCNGEHIPQCESKEMPGTSEEDHQTQGSVSGTSIHDTVRKTSPGYYIPNLMDQSSFISADLYEFLQSALPNIVKGCQWVLLYSTSRDGISLRTLLRKSVDLPGFCLLIVGDMEGAVFGGLLDCPLKPTAKRKYQGTNNSFVFTTIYDQPRLFRATGANRYYYLCLNDLLAFGGGGNFALCLDEDLLRGTSGPCDTFGNLCLAHSSEFEMKNVELWGFTHSSQYLVGS